MDFTFIVFKSDAGVHVFLLSQKDITIYKQ